MIDLNTFTLTLGSPGPSMASAPNSGDSRNKMSNEYAELPPEKNADKLIYRNRSSGVQDDRETFRP
jgi:hypothetical protein